MLQAGVWWWLQGTLLVGMKGKKNLILWHVCEVAFARSGLADAGV
jgi:hypothetical protein